jgi:hypothetical protein
MFTLFGCIISPGWTHSCQGSWRPKTVAVFSRFDPCPPSPAVCDGGFGGTGRTHRLHLTGLSCAEIEVMTLMQVVLGRRLNGIPARQVSLTVGVRHEVVQVAVVTVVSSGLTAIRRDTTRHSAAGILPGHASLVTVGYEAPGTSVSLIPNGMATDS